MSRLEVSPFGNFFQEISIHCSSCIVMSAACLEALINELYLTPDGALHRSISDFDHFFWGTSHENRRRCLPWTSKSVGLERKPALQKYRTALTRLGRPVIARNDPIYEGAESLLGFRNYLVHFKPLWDDHRRNERLEDSLRGRFAISPFMIDSPDFLAKQCMSAGCAQWAVETVVLYVAAFSQRSGIEPQKLAAFR